MSRSPPWARPGRRAASAGSRSLRRWAFFLSTLAGLGGAFAIEGALVRAGAGRPVVGVFEAVAPIAVIGLLYLARFSADQDWAVAGLGLWLVIVAAAGAYAGPRNVWAVAALAVGPAFLLVSAVEQRRAGMSPAELDPVIHTPARLRIMVTLAALRDGDDLSFTGLQDLTELTPGNLITHLRKLEEAGYVATQKNGSGVTARTSVALTDAGRKALGNYTTVLRQLLDSASQPKIGS